MNIATPNLLDPLNRLWTEIPCTKSNAGWLHMSFGLQYHGPVKLLDMINIIVHALEMVLCIFNRILTLIDLIRSKLELQVQLKIQLYNFTLLI